MALVEEDCNDCEGSGISCQVDLELNSHELYSQLFGWQGQSVGLPPFDQTNISQQVKMCFSQSIHVPQRMNPTDFGDLPTFPMEPPCT